MFTLVMQNHIGGSCMPFCGSIARGNYYLNVAGMFAALQNSMSQNHSSVFVPLSSPYSFYPSYQSYQTCSSYSTMPIYNSPIMSMPTLTMPSLNTLMLNTPSLSSSLGFGYYPSVPTLSPISLSSIGITTLNNNQTSQGLSSMGGNYDKNALPEIKNSSLLKNVPTAKKEKILGYVDKACKQYDVDPKLVISMMYAESGFNENATSPCGAAGLMQLMPGTAKQYGASDPYDIEQNIFAAVKFIKYLKDKYNGNRDLIIAAYNAGPGKVTTAVPKIKETQNYVAKVNRTYTSLA